MEEGVPRESGASLTLRWRNGLALLAAALYLGGFGTFLLLFARFPAETEIVLFATFGGFTAICGAGAVYLFRSVAQGEAELHRVGAPGHVDRSLVGTTRRTVVTQVEPAAALRAALEILADPRYGLEHVGRRWWGGVRAVRPAETGVIIVAVVPLAVAVRARRSAGRTVLTISLVPSSIYGWPVATGWIGWSSAYTWIEVAQDLTDDLARSLAGALDGTVEGR